MGASTTGPQRANLTHYNGTALAGSLNAAIANVAGLVSQLGDAALNAPSVTGASTLAVAIDTTKPYWITLLGASSNSNFVDPPRLTSFNGSVLQFTRGTTNTAEDITVEYLVVGTPL
jgi:hypothetical protein